jgi:3'-phosphoadenosine 5'-phosphosulfate sulfotransferase (PAPS reductase)/FAD synthetase
MSKPEYHVASFSGGKDSTAMVLHMIERGDRLDEVIFCDTTMEFPAMLRHVEKVKQVIAAAGIKFTTIRAEHDFEYYLTQVDVPNRKPGDRLHGVTGYGWAGHLSRWCTSTMKTTPITAYLKELREQYNVVQYIGIAADEDYRLEREQNQDSGHRHPLREWGWVEDKALRYCYDRGYYWEGLYELKKNPKTGKARVSCWCCPLQSYEDLRVLRRHFPGLWEKLLKLDSRQGKPYQHGYSVADFDRRFSLEDALTEAGESIKSRAFFGDLKRLLAREATIEEILKERAQL